MATSRTEEMAERLTGIGGLFQYDREQSQLLVQVWCALAEGKPVSTTEIDEFVATLGINPEEADQFLRQMTERDENDSVVGIMGLSLNDHPHSFSVDGVKLRTWCAEDTLFLPAMLCKRANVESESPVSKKTVRVTVGPDGVETVDPAEAVISIVVPQETDMTSVAAISMTFCHHIFFFASKSEAEGWAGDRDDIEVLTLEEGYDLGQQLWGNVLS